MADFEVPLSKYNLHSSIVQENCTGKLLKQQREALESLQKWFAPESQSRNDIALVSMPTGSGKTGVMCCLPYFIGVFGMEKRQPFYTFDKPVLVIAPDLTIADQLERQMLDTEADREENFLIRRGIIPSRKDVTPEGIKVEKTSKVNDKQHLQGKDIVLANAQKYLQGTWEDVLPDDMFKMVIVDEAHHHPAETWRRIVDKFRGHALIVFFTATPYRGDGKRVLENAPDFAYNLSLEEAILAGIIRRTIFTQVSQEIDLASAEALQNVRVREDHEAEDRAQARRFAVILKEAKIIQERKNKDSPLPNAVPHMIMAITENTDDANLMISVWNALYPNENAMKQLPTALAYHSGVKPKQQLQKTMTRLRNNKLQLVVICAMLLEGFDHPPISIAVIATKIRSPVKFAQFIGRAQRIDRSPQKNEEKGIANIVTHIYFEQESNHEKYVGGTFAES